MLESKQQESLTKVDRHVTFSKDKAEGLLLDFQHLILAAMMSLLQLSVKYLNYNWDRKVMNRLNLNLNLVKV